MRLFCGKGAKFLIETPIIKAENCKYKDSLIRQNIRSVIGYALLYGRVWNPMDIANAVLFLCSERAGFITGEDICIDGGMTKQMIYHGDCGWSLK